MNSSEVMDYLNTNETDNNTNADMQNINNSDVTHYDNITDLDYEKLPKKWYYVLESVLLSIWIIIGLAGNVAVIRGSIKAKRFAKQNVYLFIGLSLSDYFICLLRGPSLIYIIFHTKSSSDAFCEIWMVSTIFLIIAVVTNMVVAIERRMIMYNFQRYLRLFTPKRVLIGSLVMWSTVTGSFVAVYKGMDFRSKLRFNERSCYLGTDLFQMDEVTAMVFRICVVVSFGLLPILVQAGSYVSLVIKVYKAELLKLDKLDEKVTYTRITGIAFARVLVTVTCLFPVLICFAIGPMYPDVYYTNVRFLDDLIILQSAISPFVSMHDSDFRDTFVYRKWRYCSPFKHRTSSKKGSRRSNCITSADMKTFGHN
ncbi:uncharacterized protein LOC123555538 [Mercenaria mercenaria]|uniref:uncharacterized protein LOC123555538 n=1 Tax=Mercenaria mercenaria TaxID=6596 RepID=UPI00234F41D7|nr:uncharacterized protein LOC123555538 [Mercenaria mercenaria]